MKLLIAVDSAISPRCWLTQCGIRPWPEDTTAHVLSVVADMDVPEEVWREEGYGKGAVRREMETRGEQITPVAKRLEEIGIPTEVVVARGDARHLIPFFARKWSSDLIFVRAHVRKDAKALDAGQRRQSGCDIVLLARFRSFVTQGKIAHTLCTPRRRVLLATDGSETSMTAAESTFRTALA